MNIKLIAKFIVSLILVSLISSLLEWETNISSMKAILIRVLYMSWGTYIFTLFKGNNQ